jgi:hypothetical protein
MYRKLPLPHAGSSSSSGRGSHPRGRRQTQPRMDDKQWPERLPAVVLVAPLSRMPWAAKGARTKPWSHRRRTKPKRGRL